MDTPGFSIVIPTYQRREVVSAAVTAFTRIRYAGAFEDCYVDLLSEAVPVFSERGIPAVAFAVTGLASNSSEWDHPQGCTRLALLDDAGLREAAGAGIEIGGHSRTHRALSRLDTEELAAEIAGTAEDIEAKGLPRPRFFAYPYGDFDRAARDAVEAAGYLAAFTVTPGRYRQASDRFTIPRVEIQRQDIGLRFRFKTAMPALAGCLLEGRPLLDLPRRAARATWHYLWRPRQDSNL